METFKITKGEFIELNKLMKILNWVNSGGEAKMFIKNGEVNINDSTATEIRKKLRKGDVVQFDEQKVTITK